MQVSIFGDSARVHGNAETHVRGGRRGLVKAHHGELELTAMVDAHGAVKHYHADAVVAVKRAMALAYRPYSDDQPREKKVGGAVVMAGHR